MSAWTLFFAALGLAMFLEGLPYFLTPRGVRRYLSQLTLLSDGTLRLMGLGLMALGLLVVYVTLH